jgi:hypothetical protein
LEQPSTFGNADRRLATALRKLAALGNPPAPARDAPDSLGVEAPLDVHVWTRNNELAAAVAPRTGELPRSQRDVTESLTTVTGCSLTVRFQETQIDVAVVKRDVV